MRKSIVECLRGVGSLALASVITVQAGGCKPAEKVFETRQEVVSACATLSSSVLQFPDGVSREYLLVPQQDGSFYASITDTAPDGAETIGGALISEGDLPDYTLVPQPDGSAIFEMADGTSIQVSGQYDVDSGLSLFNISDPATGDTLFTMSGDGFGLPVTGDGEGGEGGGAAAGPQGFFIPILIAIVVVGLAAGGTAVLISEKHRCEDKVLPNLMSQCAQLCFQYGQGYGGFTGRCNVAGTIVYDSASGGQGGLQASTMFGCYCVNGPTPAPVVADDEAVGMNDLNPNLGFNAAGDCIPKVAAPVGSQADR